VTFAIGTDPDLAAINVDNRVQAALSQLPEEVRRQGVTIRKQSSSILQVISIDSKDPRYDEIFFTNYALLNIVDEPLATLPTERVRPGREVLTEIMDSLR